MGIARSSENFVCFVLVFISIALGFSTAPSVHSVFCPLGVAAEPRPVCSFTLGAVRGAETGPEPQREQQDRRVSESSADSQGNQEGTQQSSVVAAVARSASGRQPPPSPGRRTELHPLYPSAEPERRSNDPGRTGGIPAKVVLTRTRTHTQHGQLSDWEVADCQPLGDWSG